MTRRVTPTVRAALGAGIALGILAAVGCGGGASNATPPTPPTPAAPSASFTFSPAAPLVNEPVQFSDASTGSPASWSWAFGDGGTSTAQNPTHTFATAGAFTVTLTVANASGSNSTSRSLTSRAASTTAEVRLPGGEYRMGDHFGFLRVGRYARHHEGQLARFTRPL